MNLWTIRQTHRHTNGQTYRQTDRVISIEPALQAGPNYILTLEQLCENWKSLLVKVTISQFWITAWS